MWNYWNKQTMNWLSMDLAIDLQLLIILLQVNQLPTSTFLSRVSVAISLYTAFVWFVNLSIHVFLIVCPLIVFSWTIVPLTNFSLPTNFTLIYNNESSYEQRSPAVKCDIRWKPHIIEVLLCGRKFLGISSNSNILTVTIDFLFETFDERLF